MLACHRQHVVLAGQSLDQLRPQTAGGAGDEHYLFPARDGRWESCLPRNLDWFCQFVKGESQHDLGCWYLARGLQDSDLQLASAALWIPGANLAANANAARKVQW